MKYIFRISLLCTAVILFSCSGSQVEPMSVDIPACLQGNTEVSAYVDAYALATSQFISLSKDLSSGASMFKMARVAIKMGGVAADIEDLEAKRLQIEHGFNHEQKEALDAIVYSLEQRMGQLNDNPSGLDASEVAAVKSLKTEKLAQQSQIKDEMALRDEAIEQMKADGTWVEPKASKNDVEMPKFMHILFPILIVGAIIFSIVMSIKRIGGRVKEVGYAVSGIKEKAQDLLDDPKKVTGQDRELSNEERESLERVMKIMSNRK